MFHLPTNIKIDWGNKHKELVYIENKYNANSGIDLFEKEWKNSNFDLSKIVLHHHRLEKPYNWMKCITDIIENLEFENLSYCVHAMTSGNFLPWHIDTYKYYTKTYNITYPNDIIRIIVFLDDSVPGHILLVDKKSYTNYKKGDIAYWIGTTPHLAGNFSPITRYTLQITGTIKR